jgi:hypothetical protein
MDGCDSPETKVTMRPRDPNQLAKSIIGIATGVLLGG